MFALLKKWWNQLSTDRTWSLRFVGRETLIYREGDHELDFIHNATQNVWDFELVAWRWNSHKSTVIEGDHRKVISDRVMAWLAKNTKGKNLAFSWPA